MDCSLPGFSIHGIFQARILDWVTISFSRDLPDPGLNPGLLHCRQMLVVGMILFPFPFPPYGCDGLSYSSFLVFMKEVKVKLLSRV